MFSEPSSADGESSAPKKRGRGRPKGAKNKSKEEPAPKRQKKTLRERAEEAAVFNLNDDSEINLNDNSEIKLNDDSEICLLCLFRFDDPVKRD